MSFTAEFPTKQSDDASPGGRWGWSTRSRDAAPASCCGEDTRGIPWLQKNGEKNRKETSLNFWLGCYLYVFILFCATYIYLYLYLYIYNVFDYHLRWLPSWMEGQNSAFIFSFWRVQHLGCFPVWYRPQFGRSMGIGWVSSLWETLDEEHDENPRCRAIQPTR